MTDNGTYSQARLATGLIALALYVALIVLANWAIARFGFVPVGFGLVAPAGTYFAGFVFVCRDVLQITFGRWWVLAAIAAGAVLSWQVSPSFAVASGVAFGLGELADWAVFTPLVERGQVLPAVLFANTVGLFADTLIFLQLAFGSTAHWPGTVVGKVWMTALAIPLRLIARRTVTRWATA